MTPAGGGGRRAALAWITLVWAIVYLPALGAHGLSSSEGHRVAPAWAMLETGDWLVPELFGQAYLRKPPGVFWAIAGGGAIFGTNEFSARLPSALAVLAMSTTAWVFARRWFGGRWALSAGVATALTPMLFSPGRAAEIEALNDLWTLVAALTIVDLGVRADGGKLWRAIALGASVALMVLTKGPAGAPALTGALAGVCIATRSARPLRSWATWAGLALGAAIGVGVLYVVLERAQGRDPVLQSPGEFLWDLRRVGQVLALAPAALASALPAALTLVFVLGRRARAEASAGTAEDRHALECARAVAWSCLLGLGSLVVFGVSNPRYAQPIVVMLPVLVAWVMRGAERTFSAHRARALRVMTIGHPAVLACVLAGAGAAHALGWIARASQSGRDAGREIGALLADGTELWGDHLVEARPEVLLYARRAAGEHGHAVTPVWARASGENPTPTPPPGSFIALRTDAGSDESARYRALVESGTLAPIGSWSVHEFSFDVCRVREPSTPAE